MLAPVGLAVKAPFPDAVRIIARPPAPKPIREIRVDVSKIVSEVADHRARVAAVVGVENF
jgi:hypothetical protein